MCMFFFSDVGYCDHSICKITSPVLCNLIILHDIGIWKEQGKTMDPQLSCTDEKQPQGSHQVICKKTRQSNTICSEQYIQQHSN
jgi:hypothetical protein